MKSVLTIAVLATTALSFACATDPNKEVRDVDAAHAADVRDNKEENAALEASQEKDHAALNSDHTKQDAGMDKQVADDASKYDKARDGAEANVVEARRSFRAEATARLDQVSAKATMLDGKHKKSQEGLLASLRTNITKVKTSVATLDTVADAKWFESMKVIEASISAVEKDVKEIENKG